MASAVRNGAQQQQHSPSISSQQPPPSSSSTASASLPALAKPPPMSLDQSRAIAQTHFHALRRWLAREDGLVTNPSRTSARDKLTRLTRQQFQELSTDVYDELVRRQDARGVDQPYLSVRNEFHPKRNQARQKLATLPLQRFRDLASDVYFELERRYPEFGQAETVPTLVTSTSNSALSSSGSYTTPGSGLLASRSREAKTPGYPGSRLSHEGPVSNRSPPASNLLTNQTGNMNSTPTPTHANDMVVPNKSTLVLEEAPHGSSSQGHGSSRSVPRSSEGSFGARIVGGYAASASSVGNGGAAERRSWDGDEVESVRSNYEYKLTVLSKRAAELERENEQLCNSHQTRTVDDGRSRDLEHQLSTLSNRLQEQTMTLDSLHSTHAQALSAARSPVSRLQQDLELVTRERDQVEQVANDLRAECGSLVDELRSVNARYEELLQASEVEIDERRKVEEELRSWRKKYEGVKTELRSMKATSTLFLGTPIRVESDHMPATPDGLISDVNVSAFQTSIDALLQAARSKEPSSVLPAMREVVGVIDAIDRDLQAIVDSGRVTRMPSADQDRLVGLQAKTNATLSNLMTASKNHAMSFGVSPVSLLDAAASHLSATVIDLVRLLKIKRTSRAVSRDNSATPTNHTREASPRLSVSTPAGSTRSPGLDAPPLSASLAAQASRSRSPPAPVAPASPRSYDAYRPDPAPRSAAEDRYVPATQRPPLPSTSSALAQHQANESSISSSTQAREDPYDERTGYAHSTHSNSTSSAYGQPQDTRGPASILTYGSPRDPLDEDEDEDDWEQVKNYLETQTEAIVHSIQSLLSAIRGGAQSEQLNENLTQIITIVSSIVAISRDALLPQMRDEGEVLLRDLTDNCDRLSEMQTLVSVGQIGGGQFNKATKQAMASASFGVAKSLKSLNALLATRA